MNPASLRQQLINLTTATGGHKEQTDRYRALLEQILLIPQNEDGIQNELLQQFVEASKLINKPQKCTNNTLNLQLCTIKLAQ